MTSDDFVQNSSITRRLRIILIAISFFFLLGILAHFLSSKPLYNSLKRMNEIGNILGLTSQCLQLLDTTKDSLSNDLKKESKENIGLAFEENVKVLKSIIETVSHSTKPSYKISSNYISAQKAIETYESMVMSFIKKIKKKTLSSKHILIQKESDELFSINEYYTDAKEQLLIAQIEARRENDEIFQSVFSTRYRPLIVAVTLAFLFFSFVITIGLNLSKQIKGSLANLTKATDIIASGDLTYIAPVIINDEVGKVTVAFNSMVLSLKEKRDKLALREKERAELIIKNADRINSLIQYSLDAVVAINQEGMITSWNNQAEIIFNWTKEEAVGSQIERLVIPEKHKESLRQGLLMFLRTGNSPIVNTRIEISGVKKSGEEFPIELSIIPLSSDVGWFFYSFVRDITDKKNYESRQAALLVSEQAARENAEKTLSMQDDFISIAAHELKTPITPISMQLQLLEKSINRNNEDSSIILDTTKILKLAQNSKKEINRLAVLVDELLDISRISSGRLTLDLEEVNLSDLIQSQIDRYCPTALNSGSTLQYEIEPNVIGQWDHSRLESIIQNLLTNAIKYGNGKPIELKLKRNASKVNFLVTDHGIGISKEGQKKIFNKFERAVNVKDYSGFGLGLYIASEIVKAHGGVISVKSIENQGSTFEVELPMFTKSA